MEMIKIPTNIYVKLYNNYITYIVIGILPSYVGIVGEVTEIESARSVDEHRYDQVDGAVRVDDGLGMINARLIGSTRG